jgi:hypothetical protein
MWAANYGTGTRWEVVAAHGAPIPALETLVKLTGQLGG